MIWRIAKDEGKKGMETCSGFLNPIHCISGVSKSQCPWTVLSGLHPVSTCAASTSWSPGYCSHWQGHVLAGLRTLCFYFNHRWLFRSLLLVSQLCFSCSFDTPSLCMVFDKSFFISEKLPNLPYFRRRWM